MKSSSTLLLGLALFTVGLGAGLRQRQADADPLPNLTVIMKPDCRSPVAGPKRPSEAAPAHDPRVAGIGTPT